jgi:hypothetical protein
MQRTVTSAASSAAGPRPVPLRDGDVSRAGTPGRSRSAAALSHGLVLGALVGVVVAAVVVFGLGGLHYYTTPLGLRGYEKVHRLLRPSGLAGQALGITGFVLVLLTLLYALRKKVPFLRNRGNSRGWLEAHIFCGVAGPALITLHTSLKFNGIISVAYWSMVLVVLSGFVGRYLYVRIPRTIRGTELSLDEIHLRIDELKRREDEASLFNDRSLAFSAEISALHKEREVLVRQLAGLERTKKLFDLWHVFHRPLVWLMFAIAAAHVALALYMGYSFVHF